MQLYTTRLRKHLQEREGIDQPPPRRGILFAGGGVNQVANIVIGATYIRTKLNSTLPIEVVHYGRNEMPGMYDALLIRSSLQPLRVIDGSAVPYPAHHRATQMVHFAAKVWALYAVTSFDEVLLLDADSYPLQKPEAYFEAQPYRQHGSMFFPDFWTRMFTSRKEIFNVFGLQPPWATDATYREAESGQLLINRRRHAVALEWLWYLNAHHPYVYTQLHGDKDTYRLAFHLAGVPEHYAQSPVWNSALMRSVTNGTCPPSPYDYLVLGVVQYGWEGEPWFAHQVKFFPHARSLATNGWGMPGWVSAPTAAVQAERFLKEGCFAFNATDVAAGAWKSACGGVAHAADSVLTVAGTCGGWDAAWRAADNNATAPLPVFPVKWLPRLEAGLVGLWETYHMLRQKLQVVVVRHEMGIAV